MICSAGVRERCVSPPEMAGLAFQPEAGGRAGAGWCKRPADRRHGPGHGFRKSRLTACGGDQPLASLPALREIVAANVVEVLARRVNVVLDRVTSQQHSRVTGPQHSRHWVACIAAAVCASASRRDIWMPACTFGRIGNDRP